MIFFLFSLQIIFHHANSLPEINFEDDIHLKIVKKFALLPLLPPEKILDGFQWIVSHLNRELRMIFNSFIIRYYVFINDLGVDKLSVFEDIDGLNDATMSHIQVLENKSKGIRNSDPWEYYSEFYFQKKLNFYIVPSAKFHQLNMLEQFF